VTEAVESVRASTAVVVASPTYKATYTGLLKLFLEQFPRAGSAG
jgi:FMN reductase